MFPLLTVQGGFVHVDMCFNFENCYTYEGTPIEILTQLRAMHFDADTFDGTEGYIRYMQNTIRRMTEQPCELPEGSTEERAAALIRVLGEIGALELLEE